MKKKNLSAEEKKAILLGKPQKKEGKVSVFSTMGHWNNDTGCHTVYKDKE